MKSISNRHYRISPPFYPARFTGCKIAVMFWAMLLFAIHPTHAGADPSHRSHEEIENIRHDGNTRIDPLEKNTCAYSTEQICRYYDIIAMTAHRYEVETPLVMAIIQAESRYDPEAVSHRGAQGLMQLMPATAEAWGVTDTFDPEQNVQGGVRYFKWLLELFEGDRELALAAYNAGLKNVFHHDGVPPFPATRAYLRKVWQWYERYKRLETQPAEGGSVAAQ